MYPYIYCIKYNNNNHTNIILNYKGGEIMTFLRWIGAVAVFFWVLGLLFNVGGYLINILLVSAAVIFLIDAIFGRKKTM